MKDIFKIGTCECASIELFNDSTSPWEIRDRKSIFVSTKILASIPLLAFSSMLATNLTCKLIAKTLESVKSKDKNEKIRIRKRNLYFYIDDFNYVFNLLGRNREKALNFERNRKKPNSIKQKSLKKLAFSLNGNSFFRFSSYFLCLQISTFTILYLFFIYFSYFIIINSTLIDKKLPKNFHSDKVTIDVGDLLCSISPNVCYRSLNLSTNFNLPEKFLSCLKIFSDTFVLMFTLPLVGSFIYCFLMNCLSVLDVRSHLIKLYQGKEILNPSLRRSNQTSYLSSYLNFLDTL